MYASHDICLDGQFFGMASFKEGKGKGPHCLKSCKIIKSRSANKVQINVFCCCLIVNYGVAWDRTCYSIVYIIPWCPTTRLQPPQFSQLALYFTVTGIPFCFSGLLISFACGLWVWNVRFTGTFIPPPVLRRQERHNDVNYSSFNTAQTKGGCS